MYNNSNSNLNGSATFAARFQTKQQWKAFKSETRRHKDIFPVPENCFLHSVIFCRSLLVPRRRINGQAIDESVPVLNHSHCRFQMLYILDIRMEKFTVSLEKFNITILVISFIASLLGQVCGSYKLVLNDKKIWSLHSITLAHYKKTPRVFWSV